MEGLKTVISTVYQFANVSLTFGSFTFTIWQYWLSIAFLGICIFFIKKVFE